MSESENIYKNEYLDKYISDMESRIVNETGIPSDRYHLGKIVLRNLKDNPDFVMQIDGATGKSETNASVLRRTVQCATSMKKMGLKTGDVMILMAPNHLDLAIPFYAALYLGVAVASIDDQFEVYELKDSFNTNKPKIIFCQSENVLNVQKALELLEHKATVISFDESEHTSNFHEMLEKSSDVNVDDFKVTDFDPEETIGFLISTSGSTGWPKTAAITQKGSIINGRIIRTFGTEFPIPYRTVFIVSPLLWLSALIHCICAPYFKYTRIQSSKSITPKLGFDIINKYKPDFMIITPTVMATWCNVINEEKGDFSCFKTILIGGSCVPHETVRKVKKLTPKTLVGSAFGMSELGGPAFNFIGCPPESVGRRFSHYQYKLVDKNTGEEITEPNRSGELWLKGDGIFKGYYNNPQATEETFSKDNWFMTGDLLYRDENWNFYYVDRIKSILKYKSYQISPLELEAVIREHQGVSDVVVTGIPDPECEERAAACIVPRTGASITAQEIVDLVKEKLSETKHLRGGVYFIKEMPLTATGKVHRQKINEMVIRLSKEQSINK